MATRRKIGYERLRRMAREFAEKVERPHRRRVLHYTNARGGIVTRDLFYMAKTAEAAGAHLVLRADWDEEKLIVETLEKAPTPPRELVR